MKQQDNMTDQPRRYRAQVKRAAKGKKDELLSQGAVTPTQQAELSGTEEGAVAAKAAADPDEKEIELATDTADGTYVDKTVILPHESFDYVVPEETFKQHNSRRHVSTHKGNTKTASAEEQARADEGYIFVKRHKGKKHKKRHRHHHRKFKHLATWKKVLIIIVSILLALMIAFAGTFLILREIGNRSMHNYDGFDVDTPAADESGNRIIKADTNGRVITYNGVSYQLNENLINIVFIGVDEGINGDNTAMEMSDAIYTMSIDTETGAMKILGVSRDTIADVDLYSDGGDYVDTDKMQIAYSYAYAGGKVHGGENTTKSISRLFYGLPLKNYFAINMKALVTLNDTIGGVTLVSSMTFTSPIDGRTINKGETVTLHGKEADTYVRSRDTSKLDSNNERMQRQQEYIRAFMKSIVPAAKKDISVISKLYNEIKVNSDSSLDLPKITYIASTALTKLRNASDIEYVSLKGSITKGEYAEMRVTNEETIKTMLSVFYTPLAEVPDGLK
jgi:LCP family protein required for cell wall assembly